MNSEFFQKAKENLKASQILFDQRLFNASANRSYYAAFQITSAILANMALQVTKTNTVGFRQVLMGK